MLVAVLAHSNLFDCLGRDSWSFCGVKVATHVVSDWILNSWYLLLGNSRLEFSSSLYVCDCKTDRQTDKCTDLSIQIKLLHWPVKFIAIFHYFLFFFFFLFSYLDYYCFVFVFLYNVLKKRMPIFRKYKSRYYYNTYKIKLSITKNKMNQWPVTTDQWTPFPFS